MLEGHQPQNMTHCMPMSSTNLSIVGMGSPMGVGIRDLPVTPEINGEIGAVTILAGIDCSTKCGKHNKSCNGPDG